MPRRVATSGISSERYPSPSNNMFSEFRKRIQVTSVLSPMPGLNDDATGFIDRTLKISATGLSTIDPSIFYPRGAIGQR